MKLLLTYTAIFLITLTSFNSEDKKLLMNDEQKVDTMEAVDRQLGSYVYRFKKLMKDNNIPVDYSKINNIELLPLQKGLQGLYSPSTHDIYINYYYTFPNFPTTDQEKQDLIFMTLAHEIGHALGWEHIREDGIGLMRPYSKDNIYIIRGSLGAEQYILNTYKHHLLK